MSNGVGIRVATDARLLKRSCESLLGIAAGLIADGEINEREVQFLSTWLSENPEISQSWPGEVIYKRVREVLSDGQITFEEAEYLKQTLVDLVGGSFCDEGAIASEATTLPIESAVSVVIPQSSFCFTGKFVFGTRDACERAVEARGGSVSSINKKLKYLVIGELSSREWKYSSFGTKIEAAMRLKQEGVSLYVVGEDQWVKSL